MVFMPHWPKMLGYKLTDFGLDRIKTALQRLGDPHKKLPPVVHVAGTNGKGSTIAFLRAILEESGYKVHVYTSPHLLNFNERIVVASHEIGDDDLKTIIEKTRLGVGDLPVTFFEGTTAAAFLAFSEFEADICLLETGLGGRLDATNVIDNPLLTVITPISYDHTDILGESLELIAGEKAGIMKKGTNCVISRQEEEVHEVFERAAARVGDVDLFSYEYDWVVEKLNNNKMLFQSVKGDIELPVPALLGNHQLVNAGCAIAASKMLQDFNISDEAIARAMLSVKWPGRMQPVKSSKLLGLLPPGSNLWMDGAHNPGGAATLAETFSSWEGKDIYIICGLTRGRSVVDFVTPMKEYIKLLCGVLVETEPSALIADKIANDAASMGVNSYAADDVEDALRKISEMSEGKECNVVLCGSLYLISDIMANYKLNKSNYPV